MRQQRQCSDHQAGGGPGNSLPSPENCQPKTSEPQRQIVIHESHAEGIAVGQHGDTRREKPRRPFCDRSNERENSPEKKQHANRHGDLLRRSKSHKIRQPQQCDIKQNIVPLLRDVQSRRLSLGNQLREPCVIHVARQVPSLNAPVPYARHKNQGRNRQSRDNPRSEPSPARPEETLTFPEFFIHSPSPPTPPPAPRDISMLCFYS